MKKEIIIVSIILLLIFIAVFAGELFTVKVSGGFGEDCEKARSIEYGEYFIQEYECIGLAGPHYNQYSLTKNSLIVSENGTKLDSCHVEFVLKDENIVKFNLCENKIAKSE